MLYTKVEGQNPGAIKDWLDDDPRDAFSRRPRLPALRRRRRAANHRKLDMTAAGPSGGAWSAFGGSGLGLGAFGRGRPPERRRSRIELHEGGARRVEVRGTCAPRWRVGKINRRHGLAGFTAAAAADNRRAPYDP
jgi:hypothetical protein